MKVEFPDRSYVEIRPSQATNKFILTIAARDNKEPLSTIANSVELTKEQLSQLFFDLIH